MDIQQLIRDLKYIDEILEKEDYRPGGHARSTIADALSVIQQKLQQTHVMQAQSAEPLPGDAVEFIANALGEEVRLRQMIDLWCIDQFGNTDEALDKADAMFTAARDIFYRSGNGA